MTLLFFLLGMVFTICLFNGKIDIRIHHIHEEIKNQDEKVDLDAALKTLNEPDSELDEVYKAMGEVKDIMEGSDRIDVKEQF